MRVSNEKSLWTNGFFKLKDESWLEKQRIAGQVAAKTLMLLEKLVREKAPLTLFQMNVIAEDYIYQNKCIPTFKNYKGTFPAGVCMSVNKQLVHGIPAHYKLQDGDVVSFDLGTTFEGAIADTAITCLYGEAKPEHIKLIAATNEALMKGIAAIGVGKRLGVIGHAIFRSARGNDFSVVDDYGGHGLDWNIPHAAPFIANKADPDEGIRIQTGLAIAIEPMLVPRDTSTSISEDGWTVNTKEIGAHAEHSVFVHEDRTEIITWREDSGQPKEILHDKTC